MSDICQQSFIIDQILWWSRRRIYTNKNCQINLVKVFSCWLQTIILILTYLPQLFSTDLSIPVSIKQCESFLKMKDSKKSIINTQIHTFKHSMSLEEMCRSGLARSDMMMIPYQHHNTNHQTHFARKTSNIFIQMSLKLIEGKCITLHKVCEIGFQL